MGITEAKFDELIKDKVLSLAARTSTTKGLPDFEKYRKTVSMFIPATASFEADIFRLRTFTENKLSAKAIDQLALMLSSTKYVISPADLMYFTTLYAKEIVSGKRHAQFIKLLSQYKIGKAEADKNYSKNVALFSIYSAMKDKKNKSVYQSKLMMDPQLPSYILDWVLAQ